MHRRAPARLGDDHRRLLPEKVPDLLGKALALRHHDVEVGVAQDSEPRPRRGAKPLLAAHDAVVEAAVAEEREMVRGHPLQERRGLAAFGRVEAGGRGPQARHGVLDPLDDRPPVRDGVAHVGQDPLEVGADLGAPRGIGAEVDFGVDPGLTDRARNVLARRRRPLRRAAAAPHDRQDGMDHELDAAAAALEAGRHRVDEERHVVVDDLDHRVRGGPGVAAGAGVVDPDRGLARSPPAAQAPDRMRGAEQILRRQRADILGRRPAIEEPQEGREPRQLGLAQPASGKRGRRGQSPLLRGLIGSGHGSGSLWIMRTWGRAATSRATELALGRGRRL